MNATLMSGSSTGGDKRAMNILRELYAAEEELVGRAVVLTDGKWSDRQGRAQNEIELFVDSTDSFPEVVSRGEGIGEDDAPQIESLFRHSTQSRIEQLTLRGQFLFE